MLHYFLKRLLGLLPTLFLVAVIVFLFVHMLPGDPARLAAGPEADQVTVELPRAAVERLAGETGVGLRIETGLAQVDLSSRALAALAGAGGRTVSVSVGQGADGVRTIAVLVDGKPVETLPGGIRVAFPAAEAGLVTALVGADDAAAPLKKSLVADGTAYLLLPGSASVALIRGTETFADVPDGYWGAEAVAFAASRGLLQGVGGNRFYVQLARRRHQ